MLIIEVLNVILSIAILYFQIKINKRQKEMKESIDNKDKRIGF